MTIPSFIYITKAYYRRKHKCEPSLLQNNYSLFFQSRSSEFEIQQISIAVPSVPITFFLLEKNTLMKLMIKSDVQPSKTYSNIN